ncbi:hypothetical protein ACT414_18580 (plasmid) [Acinetobacter baumannii]
MEFIQERVKNKAESCSFYADIGTSANPQDSFSVHIKVLYSSVITQLGNEGLSFEAYHNDDDHGDKVLSCSFKDYVSEAALIIKCKDDVENVTLIELALDYIGASNLKYVVSERYIEAL